MNKQTTTYVISLARATTRRDYIVRHCNNLGINYKIVEAIDGTQLSAADKEKLCDMERVRQSPYWLTDGAIACALSHRKAYLEFLATDKDFALIIEDDAILPHNIAEITEEITHSVSKNSVTLLYYTSFKPAMFSTKNAISFNTYQLVLPMDIRQPTTTTAYIIGRDAARNLAERILPIRVAADSWSSFYKWKCFDEFRVQFPMSVKTKNFKSSIDYFPKGSLKHAFSNFVDKHRIPLLYQILGLRRKRLLNKMLGHFYLTDEHSPIEKK